MKFIRNNFKKISIILVLFVLFFSSVFSVAAAEDINFNSNANQLNEARLGQKNVKEQLSRLEALLNNNDYDLAEELLADLLAIETLTEEELAHLEQLSSDLKKAKSALTEETTVANIDSDSASTELSEEELENSESPALFSTRTSSIEMSTADQAAAEDLYNRLMSSNSVSGRWNLAQELQASYPMYSKVQEAIDFAVTSNLNYAQNKHKAGDYGTAIYYYERVLGELPAGTSQTEVIENNLSLAKSKKKPIMADDLYNRLMSSNSVSGRWNLAQEFKAKFPYDSRLQKAIDFAVNSNLNYAQNKHRAGDYKTATSYYDRLLSAQESFNLSDQKIKNIKLDRDAASNGQALKSQTPSPPRVHSDKLKAVLNEGRKWIGTKMYSDGHKYMIDTYNNQPNLPRNMKMAYQYHWCDVFISFLGIETGTTDIIGSEAYVPFHMQFFMNKGQWIEDGTIKPQPGDIVFINWYVPSQPNNAVPGHLALVENVYDNHFTTIDGNIKVDGVPQVVRREVKFGERIIRGFARPQYK